MIFAFWLIDFHFRFSFSFLFRSPSPSSFVSLCSSFVSPSLSPSLSPSPITNSSLTSPQQDPHNTVAAGINNTVAASINNVSKSRHTICILSLRPLSYLFMRCMSTVIRDAIMQEQILCLISKLLQTSSALPHFGSTCQTGICQGCFRDGSSSSSSHERGGRGGLRVCGSDK